MDSTAWDQRYAERELVWSAGPNQFVADLAGPLPSGRAVDLAAGEGRNAIWLATRGWMVTAVDFSAVALDKGRRLAAQAGVTESLTWVEADLTRWVPDPSAFDLVLVAYLQLPWPEMAGLLARAAEAVAPGGTLLIVGHDRSNLVRGAGGPQDPSVLYTPQEVSGAVGGSAGVAVTRADTVERISDAGAAYDTLVVARRA